MPEKLEPKDTWRSSRSRYFPDPLSAQTLKPIRRKLNAVSNSLSDSGVVKFLDMSDTTSQLVLNLLILWADRKITEKGPAALEKELRAGIEELETLTGQSMIDRGIEIDAKYLPEGIRKKPKKAKEPKDTKDTKPEENGTAE